LNKKKCKSLAYNHSKQDFDYDFEDKYLATEFAYNYHDLEVHWTKDSIAKSKANYSKSKKFLLSSPLWASKEFINVNSTIEDLKRKKNKDKLKIISVFSSQFGSSGAYNSVESHYYLLKFLKEILKNEEDIFLVFKPKYNIERLNNYLDLKKLIDHLNENKMFKLVNNVRSVNLIDISDLTISMTFSSATIEAISSGKKSFYVDLADSFPNSPNRKISNFVATSIPDALKKIKFWLSCDSEKFLNFLNTEVKNRLKLNYNNESIEDIRSIVLKEISGKI
jgi:polysaccharide biosynthesis PFTS motif protein